VWLNALNSSATDVSLIRRCTALGRRGSPHSSSRRLTTAFDGTRVEVEDRCGGLPQGNAGELFEPFVQQGENRTGFGLGLAIVKQALEAHGGRVSVRNLPGKGCVFSLDLPDSTHD
jgi:signal transduction histidine kinase